MKLSNLMIVSAMVYATLGFIVTLLQQFSGAVNALGWTSVLLYLLFALGFAYFLLAKPRVSTTSVRP